MLVTCAVRDGNLALNTGPMPDGRIEPRQVERFREIGAWLKKYGESIYGTRGGPWRDAPWGGTTHRGERVFVHVLRWPGDEVRLASDPREDRQPSRPDRRHGHGRARPTTASRSPCPTSTGRNWTRSSN